MSGLRLNGVIVVVPRDPIIIYQLRRASPTQHTFWLAGDLATPVELFKPLVTTTFMAYPQISPVADEYIYAVSASPPNLNRLGLDDVAAITTIDSKFNIQPLTMGWSPDGQKVYFKDTTANGFFPIEFRRVNRDGTNDTFLYSRTTPPDRMLNAYASLSPDGSFIAWLDINSGDSDQTGATRGIWMMNSDGTGVSFIDFWATGGATSDRLMAISPDSTRILYFKTTSGVAREWFTIEPDGSNKTTIFSWSVSPVGPYQLIVSDINTWDPDGTRIIVRRRPFPAVTEPQDQIMWLSTDGSQTLTPLSTPRFAYGNNGGNDHTLGPVVFGDRIYWTEGTSPTEKLVSTWLDGDDYRVDHDIGAAGWRMSGFYFQMI